MLGCLLAGDIYVVDMWGRIGGSSGRIHLAVDRLKQQGLVWSAWVDQPPGAPAPKRLRYGLTVRALDAAQLHRDSQEHLGAMGQEDRALLARRQGQADLYRDIADQIARIEGDRP